MDDFKTESREGGSRPSLLNFRNEALLVYSLDVACTGLFLNGFGCLEAATLKKLSASSGVQDPMAGASPKAAVTTLNPQI